MVQTQTPSSTRVSLQTLPEGRWIDIGGVRTRYYDAGIGEAIVLIYGGNFGSADSSASAFLWNKNLPVLARAARVIAFDKLGQGLTDNPKDDDYTIAAVVRHAADFVRAMKLPPVHIVGQSRGAYVAMRLTLENHDLVRSVTLVNSGTLSPGVGTNDVVLCNPPYPSGTRECARWVYENYCFSPESVTDDWIDDVMESLASPKYQESIRKMGKERLASKLFGPGQARDKRETLQWLSEGRLQRPIQIIWGFNDRTVVIDRGVELFQLIAAHESRAQFHVVNKAGHFPFREQAQSFNALVAQFVARNAAE